MCRRKKKCIRFTQPGDCPSGDEGEVALDTAVGEATETKKVVGADNNGDNVDGDVELAQTVGEGIAVEGQSNGETQPVDIIVVKEE